MKFKTGFGIREIVTGYSVPELVILQITIKNENDCRKSQYAIKFMQRTGCVATSGEWI